MYVIEKQRQTDRQSSMQAGRKARVCTYRETKKDRHTKRGGGIDGERFLAETLPV